MSTLHSSYLTSLVEFHSVLNKPCTRTHTSQAIGSLGTVFDICLAVFFFLATKVGVPIENSMDHICHTNTSKESF